MPLVPDYTYEEETDRFLVTVTLRGIRPSAVDVLLTPLYVKVSGGSYVLQLDVWRRLVPTDSSYRVERPVEPTAEPDVLLVNLILRKEPRVDAGEGETVWGGLVLPESECPTRRERRIRRHNSLQEASSEYTRKLQHRKDQKEAEGKRYFHLHWEEEKKMREEVEAMMKLEKLTEEEALYRWEEEMEKKEVYGKNSGFLEKIHAELVAIRHAADAEEKTEGEETSNLDARVNPTADQRLDPSCSQDLDHMHQGPVMPCTAEEAPASNDRRKDIFSGSDLETGVTAERSSLLSTVPPPPPGVRTGSGETFELVVEMTPKQASLPMRTRGDEEYYRRSRYQPKCLEDTPMFWKHKGDDCFRVGCYRDAAMAYSEALKRDACFVSCIANRAAAWLCLHEYQRCIDDCAVAVTMVNNTPASETSGERYRSALMKLYARKGAAYLWAGSCAKALECYQIAVAHRIDAKEHPELLEDLSMIQRKAAEDQESVMANEDRINTVKHHEADTFYLKLEYEKALAQYLELLESDSEDLKARSNLCACYLQLGRFEEVLRETGHVIHVCNEIAQVIASGSHRSPQVDSDDEEEEVKEAKDCNEDPPRGKEINETNTSETRGRSSQLLMDRTAHVYILLKAYVRRGAAYCGLKDYSKGYECYEHALRITPYDDDLRTDTQNIFEKMRMNNLIEMSRRPATAA